MYSNLPTLVQHIVPNVQTRMFKPKFPKFKLGVKRKAIKTKKEKENRTVKEKWKMTP